MEDCKEAITFLDMMDLDEDLIDKSLRSIMERSHYSNSVLKHAVYLLKYKQLINTREESDCDNQEELHFLVKLIMNLDGETIDSICEILPVILGLNRATILQNSEHLLQQILSNLESSCYTSANEVSKTRFQSELQILHYLKLCDSILDAVEAAELKLYMPFLDTPLELLFSSNETIKLHFLVSTVPRLFKTVNSCGIMDRIWKFLIKMKKIEMSLNVLSCLSNYYLPILDEQGYFAFESYIITQYEFWDVLLQGLANDNDHLRKIAIYLCKRSIDYLFYTKKNICLTDTKEKIFEWKCNESEKLKQKWNNFFILIESLEEKQSNIVLPSLKLFDDVRDLGPMWLNCAYKIGLKHDNTQVKYKCIENKLKDGINTEKEAIMFLDAINDVSTHDYVYLLEQQFYAEFNGSNNIMLIMKALPCIKWSSIPLFYLSQILAAINVPELPKEEEIIKTILDILKIPCNNVILRKAIEINMTYFIGRNLKNLNWNDYLELYLKLKQNVYKFDDENLFNQLIMNINLTDGEKIKLFEHISHKKNAIGFVYVYLTNHIEDCNIFLSVLLNGFTHVNDVVSRQYANKKEILDDVHFLTQAFLTFKDKSLSGFIDDGIRRNIGIVIPYMLSLLFNNEALTPEESEDLCEILSKLDNDHEENFKKQLLHLYKSSILLLEDENKNFECLVLPLIIVRSLTYSEIMNKNYGNEMLDVKRIMEIMEKKRKVVGGVENGGRLINLFYEKMCEMAFFTLNMNRGSVMNVVLIDFVFHVLDCGGYGCLKWILRIINIKLPFLLQHQLEPEFDVSQFINKTWKEVEELKSNNQYLACMESFIDLITHEELLKRSIFNNTVIFYCNKIIDYGHLNISPLKYLVKKIYDSDILLEHGQMVCVLSEILLYSPITRKDQRINDAVNLQILENSKYSRHIKMDDANFTFEIKYTSVLMLSKICNSNILRTIIDFVKNKIELALKSKQRYHGNSQLHKLLTIGLQHLLIILLKNHTNLDLDKLVQWCINLLTSMPHQPSVRIILEWFVSFYIILKDLELNADLYAMMHFKEMPTSSQFYVLYWVTKHKSTRGILLEREFEFVMGKLLAHTMGQTFNVRLTAQYLTKNLYSLKEVKNNKYAYIMEVVQNTFLESANDKNYVKLRNDFFANNFEIVKHFTPCFIYYFLPRYCDQGNSEILDVQYVANIMTQIDLNIGKDFKDSKSNEFWKTRISNKCVFHLPVVKQKDVINTELNEVSGTIQKKYIPWRNMTDIELQQNSKKKTSKSELILVASLIDKLPNLGGMARTSEVFGVKTYIVDSLRHLQDKIFQGLSVSAERWVDVKEVRPGEALKSYLMKMKEEGYSVVAAEQTSSSVKLEKFRFPKKTILLLGHEKEGIPCDLLPIMDYCVEIPQQGFVRSLNVHVTAAIFIWEYTRQYLI